MNKNGDRRMRDRGQTLIEFALIAPVLFLLVLGIVDFGGVIDQMLTAQHSVEDASRRGAVEPDVASIITYAESQSHGLLDGKVKVCFVDEDGDGEWGEVDDTIRVEGSFTHYFGYLSFIHYFGVAWDPSITIHVNAEKRLEKGADADGYHALADGTCP